MKKEKEYGTSHPAKTRLFPGCAGFLGTVFLSGIVSLQNFAVAQEKEEPAPVTRTSSSSGFREVLADPRFENGFEITGTTHAGERRRVSFSEEKAKPQWTIAQWNSRGTLDRTQLDRNCVSLSDAYKSVTLDRRTGAVRLRVDASREYETPRTSISEPWVHLLLEQSPFQKPIPIEHAREIRLELEFELTKCREHGTTDPAFHAAQFSWFLYLKNTNRDSKGYHDFLWFGLALFDSRYDFVPLYAAQDFAMPEGKFIYTLGSRSAVEEKIAFGKRYKVSLDILPEIENALKIAKKNGFLTHTTSDDLSIDGTNIGWELPGMFDVDLTIHDISVRLKDSVHGVPR